MTTPMTGRFRVCPGTGAGHWSISLQTVDTGGRCQKPFQGTEMRQCWPCLMTTYLLPGRVPASQSIQGRSGLGVTETAGQMAGGTPALKTVMMQANQRAFSYRHHSSNSVAHGSPESCLPRAGQGSTSPQSSLTHVSGLDKRKPDVYTLS